MIQNVCNDFTFALPRVINVNVKQSTERIMIMTEELTREQIAEKYEANFQKFIDGLEKLSKQCGIAISACGCFPAYDLDGFKAITYKRDSSSGDLDIASITFSDRHPNKQYQTQPGERAIIGLDNGRPPTITTFACQTWKESSAIGHRTEPQTAYPYYIRSQRRR